MEEKSGFVRKNKPQKLEKSSAIKEAGKISDRYVYLAALRYLTDEEINLRSASINGDEFELSYSQARFTSYPQTYGRVLNTLDQILPNDIQKITLIPKNRNLYLSSFSIDRNSFKNASVENDFNYAIYSSTIDDGF